MDKKDKRTNEELMDRFPNSESGENRAERSKYVYGLVNGWIENADSKVGISCGIFTGVFGVVTFLTERYIKALPNAIINECWRCLYKISFILSCIAMAVAVILYAMAVIPNLKSSGNKKPKQKKYPLFYGDISALSFTKYRALMEKGTEKDFVDELILESWTNSGICMRKMKLYKAGVILSIVAVLLALLSMASHFLMYK